MKIIIESTSHMVKLNGIDARLWVGTTASGTPVHCFVTRIAAPVFGHDLAEFDRELETHQPPSRELIDSYPFRMVV